MAVNKVDAILARFPGPVTLRVSRLKMLALLAGYNVLISLAMAAIAGWGIFRLQRRLY